MITYETRNDLIDTLPKDLVVAELGEWLKPAVC